VAVGEVLLPFSLREVGAHAAPAVPAARREEARRKTSRMLVWGGYPAAWLGSRPERALSNLVEAVVLRDASDRFRIQRPDALRTVLQLAAGQAGQMVNLSEWASLAGISAPTVRGYLGILEESWVLRLVPAFAGGKRREISSASRVHFYDPGLRNALLHAFDKDIERRADRGALFEGLVFAELAKTLPRDWSVRYWRATGGGEMDFILTRGDRCVGVKSRRAGARASAARRAASWRPTRQATCCWSAGSRGRGPSPRCSRGPGSIGSGCWTWRVGSRRSLRDEK
jgi:predicted AAA+ superfamily ATPase